MNETTMEKVITAATLADAKKHEWRITDGRAAADPVTISTIGPEEANGDRHVTMSTGKKWWFHPDSRWGCASVLAQV